jgi:hypothetical protein
MHTATTKRLNNDLFAHIFAGLFAEYLQAQTSKITPSPPKKRIHLGALRGDGPMQVVCSRNDRA